MAERQRHFVKKILRSKILLLGLVLVLFFTARATYNISKKEKISRERYGSMLRELYSIEERERELEANISRLETPEGRDEAIREKYRLKKEGEQLIILLDEEKKNRLSEKSKNSLWDRVKNLFK